ncbi:hypothetical protein BD413DRAFT_716457, partial [Trametes elegans]
MSSTDERALVPYPSMLLCTMVLTVTKPVPLRLFLTALAMNHVRTLLSSYHTGDSAFQDYTYGGAISGLALAMLVFAWLLDPLRTSRYRGEAVPPGQYPLVKRMYYVGCMLMSPRTIGWNRQIPCIPPSTAHSRGQFIRQGVLTLVTSLVGLDLAQSYLQLQPVASLMGTEAFPTGWRGHVMRVLCLLAWYGSHYFSLLLAYTVLSIFCVATGIGNGNYNDWRPIFGKHSDAYTLRRFWGRTWHQNLRIYFSTGGRTVTNALGLKKGSW